MIFAGHARSLSRSERYVDQRKNLGEGIMPLGEKVLAALLDDQEGRRTLIDLKRIEPRVQKSILRFPQERTTPDDTIPLICESWCLGGGTIRQCGIRCFQYQRFYQSDIDFDEEIVNIERVLAAFLRYNSTVAGLPAERPETASTSFLKPSPIPSAGESLEITFGTVQSCSTCMAYIAWGTASIGSDYDGSVRNHSVGYAHCRRLFRGCGSGFSCFWPSNTSNNQTA